MFLFGGGLFGSGRGSLLGGGLGDMLRCSDGPSNSRGTGNLKAIINTYKGNDTMGGQIFQTIDDAIEEFHELCTDGFVEMVIKGNSDYKTSFEIRDEADEVICEARAKFNERCMSFNKFLQELNKKINYIYEKKVNLAKRLDIFVNEMPNLPKLSGYLVSPSYSYQPSTIRKICEYVGLISSDVKGRKEGAIDYLEDAKDFEVEIYGKIAEINRVETFLSMINMSLDEEELLINVVNDSIDKKRSLQYDAIAKQIHILLAEYILDSNGNKNMRYMEAIHALNKLS